MGGPCAVTITASIDGEVRATATHGLPGFASEAIGALPSAITRHTWPIPSEGRDYVLDVKAGDGEDVICNLAMRHTRGERWTIMDRITGETRNWDGVGSSLGPVGHHPW